MTPTAKKVVVWYQQNKKPYPWRKTRTPYRVWLSEILLQQTRIPVALEFYAKILKQYPTVQDLARSNSDLFVSSWSGIGYYNRARNMIRCANDLVEKHNGRFPSDLSSLLELPGIGPYTAGALRNICFDQLTPAIDGNIRRVLARITGNRAAINSRRFRREVEHAFLQLGHNAPAGDYFQGLMELGEQICLPIPKCEQCPVSKDCVAFRNNIATKLPVKPKKKPSEPYHWYFVVLPNSAAAYHYVRNPNRDFLREAWMFPDILSKEELKPADIHRQFKKIWGIELKEVHAERGVRHAVTFRKIHGHVLIARQFRIHENGGKWLTVKDLESYPTSSIIHKILRVLSKPTVEKRPDPSNRKS